MKTLLKFFIIFFSLILFLHFSSIQLYPWFKHYGGTIEDNAKSIQQTSDGGYVVAGNSYSYSYGGEDFAIYKLNSSGNKVWFKHYGGLIDDRANSIHQTSDGGYIVSGYTYSYTYGGSDFAIYKLNSSGNKVWFKHYGGGNGDAGQSIQQTSDGGYIVCGHTSSYTYGSSDFAIYKLDSSGNKVWFKHYGGSLQDRAFSIQQTSDGGYVVAGYTDSYTYGNTDSAIYKLDSNGNKSWFKHYGGTDNDYGFSIHQTLDGGYVVTGYSNSYTYGGYDFTIYKLNSSGNKVWFKHYGGASNDYGCSIRQTSNGGYIVAGRTYSYSHGSTDFGIYKLNSSGNKTWFKHYGGTSYDEANSIQQTSGGGYIVAGYTSSYTYGAKDFAIYKLDSNGDK